MTEIVGQFKEAPAGAFEAEFKVEFVISNSLLKKLQQTSESI